MTDALCRFQDAADTEQEAEVPQAFVCPITHALFEDPVIAMDGHSYERAAISRWLTAHPDTSGVTHLQMISSTILVNWALRTAIEAWRASQGLPEMSPPASSEPLQPAPHGQDCEDYSARLPWLEHLEEEEEGQQNGQVYDDRELFIGPLEDLEAEASNRYLFAPDLYGAWTPNAHHFNRRECQGSRSPCVLSLTHIGVCWLDIEGVFQDVGAGDYRLLCRMQAHAHAAMERLEVTTTVLSATAVGPGASDRCVRIHDGLQQQLCSQRGRWVLLDFGALSLAERSDVKVTMVNKDGEWKQNVTWDCLILSYLEPAASR